MATRAERSKPVAERTHYTSQPVDVPSSFLTTPPESPVTFRHISFADSPVPEYAGCFAVLLDNVLAPWECAKLLQLAEASVPGAEEGGASWRPALVNMGGGYEAAVTDYRNSDRIIWDSQTVVDRVWQRCLQARGGEGEEDMGQMLSKTPEGREERKRKYKNWGGEWKFERLNERMRFLKYTEGQFFKRKSPVRESFLIVLLIRCGKKRTATVRITMRPTGRPLRRITRCICISTTRPRRRRTGVVVWVARRRFSRMI